MILSRLCLSYCSAAASSYQWENFLGIIISLWVAHLTGVGFDFIMTVPFLLVHCSFFFVLGCGLSFLGGFQYLPVNGCSTASCNVCALAGEVEKMFFYSTILKHVPPSTVLVWEMPWAEEPGELWPLTEPEHELHCLSFC